MASYPIAIICRIAVITTSYGIRSNVNANDYLKKYLIDLYEISVLNPTSIPSPKSKRIIKTKFLESDIVYFFVRMGGLEHYLLKLQNSLKKPVIAGHHGVIDQANIRISVFQRLYYKIYGGRDGRTVKRFAGQHVLNKKDFETLFNRKFQEIFLIPNGIELCLPGLSQSF